MRQISVSSSSEQTIYASLELSKNSWLLAIQLPGRDKPSLHPIGGGNAEGLMTKLDAARDRLTKISGQTPKVTLCYEAGYDGFWLSRFLEQRGIDCLVMEPASLQVIREEVRQFLANPDGHESCTAAYRTYYAQFDHPLSAAYGEAVADLSEAERKQLLMMAGKGWDNLSFFLSPLIIELASFCAPEAGAIISRWTELPPTDSFMPQDAIGVFVVAHIALGRLGCLLPERQTEPDNPSAESLAACGAILYWSNRTDLDEDARCTACRQPLSVLARHELGAAVDAIRHCEHALVEGVERIPGQGLVQRSIVNCFPVEVTEFCRQALKSPSSLIGYFTHFDRRQVLGFCIQVLGNHGNVGDLMLWVPNIHAACRR